MFIPDKNEKLLMALMKNQNKAIDVNPYPF